MRTNVFLTALFCAGLLACGCSSKVQPVDTNAGANVPKLQVTSPAFAEGQPIPDKYTGQGDDVSPPLQWTPAPPNTKSLVLICEDPDAPMGTFTHWIIYNMPPSATGLPENKARSITLINGSMSDGSEQGKNSFGNIGYNGPAPPPGKLHHYYFRLYALDTVLSLDAGADKSALLAAMQDHILAEGELMGTYQRQ